MSLSHEFLIISPDRISPIVSFSLLYDKNVRFGRFDKILWPCDYHSCQIEDKLSVLTTYYNEHRNNCVKIADEFVLPVVAAFERVDTFAHGFIPYRGLYYYGFTIVPYESIESFREVLASLPQEYKYNNLIELCKEALIQRKCILHCGI